MLNIKDEFNKLSNDIKNLLSDLRVGKITEEEFKELDRHLEYRYCLLFIAKYELEEKLKKEKVNEA